MEKIFSLIRRIAFALLKYRITEGHNPNLVEEKDINKDYCISFIVRTKQLDQQEDVDKAMKTLVKAEKNCIKEINELRAETDSFCKGGNRSEFGRWIEANFVENESEKAHRKLEKHCAYIEMVIYILKFFLIGFPPSN